MTYRHTEIKQKSHIIIDVGGSFLKSAVLNNDGFVHDSSCFITDSSVINKSINNNLFKFN